MRKIVEQYKKEIETFLATLKIFKGNKAINSNKALNAKNKKFIKKKFSQFKNGNVNEEALDMALEALLPYLYQANRECQAKCVSYFA